jgi:purine-nucleoside phosphorylase
MREGEVTMPGPSPSHSIQEAEQAAAFLNSTLKEIPRIALILGTGLGDTAAAFEMSTGINYAQIPHFPLSTVESHHGRLIAGRWAGRPVAVLQGRFHLYEGYTGREVTFPVRVLQALGVGTIIITNASGGLNPSFKAGDIMVIRDHINLTGDNPLVGPNEDGWGPRFPGMTQAYTPELADRALRLGRQCGLGLQSGTYAGLKGPSLETAAEMRFLRTIGADAVGFSTVMETIAAVHAGMKVIGLSTITNMCLPDALTDTDVAEIIATAESAAPQLATLITALLESMH